MDGTLDRPEIRGGKDVTSVNLGAELRELLDSLPDKREGHPRQKWTREQDEALLYAWERKPQRMVAKLIRKGIQCCRERYRELTDVQRV